MRTENKLEVEGLTRDQTSREPTTAKAAEDLLALLDNIEGYNASLLICREFGVQNATKRFLGCHFIGDFFATNFDIFFH